MNKRAMIEEQLEKGLIQLLIDSNHQMVDLPPEYLGQTHLALNLSWKFRVPINLSPIGISVELSFDGTPYECFLPWEAVWALKDKSGNLHLFHVPLSILEEGQEKVGAPPKFVLLTNQDAVPSAPRRNHLRVLH